MQSFEYEFLLNLNLLHYLLLKLVSFLLSRSCIRPEISRTRTFGRIGVSKGQYYDKHLKYILLGEGRHDFKTSNLTYLLKVSP